MNTSEINWDALDLPPLDWSEFNLPPLVTDTIEGPPMTPVDTAEFKDFLHIPLYDQVMNLPPPPPLRNDSFAIDLTAAPPSPPKLQRLPSHPISVNPFPPQYPLNPITPPLQSANNPIFPTYQRILPKVTPAPQKSATPYARPADAIPLEKRISIAKKCQRVSQSIYVLKQELETLTPQEKQIMHGILDKILPKEAFDPTANNMLSRN